MGISDFILTQGFTHSEALSDQKINTNNMLARLKNLTGDVLINRVAINSYTVQRFNS